MDLVKMKAHTRNIVDPNVEGSQTFAVTQHIILRNGWEYYLEATDKDGYAFGFVMGFENEWGSVNMKEIEPYIASIARGFELDYIMAPFGYIWEDEKELHERA
tara:strand:- start:4 stop:312 length:309 start_codon:yes stop_codon:yes gene_type:complete